MLRLFAPQSRFIRIYEISKPKGGNFLRAVSFPFNLIIDTDSFARLYIEIPSKSLFCRKEDLEKKLENILEALSSEYDFRWVEEALQDFSGSFFYTATYSDSRIVDLVETLILNGVRARIILTLRPQGRWLCSLIIASDREILHILKTHLSDVRRISEKVFRKAEGGSLINPKLLKRLTLQRMPGVSRLPTLHLKIPVRFTFEPKNAIKVGKVIHFTTGKETVDAFLPIQRINQHVAILATTGAGKTNLCRHLVIELHRKGIPCLIFDWKQDYRDLAKKIDASVYDFQDNLFTFNPLKPAGDPAMWAKELANIMAEVISGGAYGSGAFSVYVKLIDELYRERGVYDGSRNYPTVFDLLGKLENLSREKLSERERNWVASALKLFRSLAVGKTREAFGVKEGLSIAELLEKTVIIELESLGDPIAKAFLISVLLQKIRNYRLSRPERDRLKHVIVIEEAQNVLKRDSEASSIITATYREIRSLCEGIIAITQMPSEFSKDALANTNTFFVMRLVHRDDKLVARDLLGLNREQLRILEHLEKGVAFMKTDGLCMVKIPLVEREDVEVKREKPERQHVAASPAKRNDVRARAEDLSEREWEVLRCIGESLACNNSQLQKVLGLSNDELKRIIGRLIEKGFVRYAYAKRKGAGRKQKVYFLFPYGEEAYRQRFGEWPDIVRARKRRSKLSHEEMKREVMKALGIKEGKFGRFDIIAEDGPIEIETGSNRNDQIYENIKKSVEEFGFARFVVADEITFNAVLQQAAKYKFEERKKVIVQLSVFNNGRVSEFDHFILS
ncbi:helicase HerA domain-containing protein [Archaeoglobus sp.]